MAQELKVFDIIYMFIMYAATFFSCVLVCALTGFYSSPEIKEIFKSAKTNVERFEIN